jgi:hypothetical protein
MRNPGCADSPSYESRCQRERQVGEPSFGSFGTGMQSIGSTKAAFVIGNERSGSAGIGGEYYLLQLRVLRLRLLQDGDVRVGVFPEAEEIPISGAGFCGVTL